MTKREKAIDAACILAIAAILTAAVCVMMKTCHKTANKELASAYRYVGNVIW